MKIFWKLLWVTTSDHLLLQPSKYLDQLWQRLNWVVTTSHFGYVKPSCCFVRQLWFRLCQPISVALTTKFGYVNWFRLNQTLYSVVSTINVDYLWFRLGQPISIALSTKFGCVNWFQLSHPLYSLVYAINIIETTFNFDRDIF